MKLGYREWESSYTGESQPYVWGFVDPGLLEAAFEITPKPEEADLAVFINAVPRTFDPARVVLLQAESPVAEHRRWTYENFDRFALVVCHNPGGANQLPFGTNPAVFPWNPCLELDRRRPDTRLTDRKVFYAAQKVERYGQIPDAFGTRVLYGFRVTVVERMQARYPDQFVLYGRGWESCITGKCARTLYQGGGNWRKAKLEDICDSGADFVLVFENTIQENLITEKIHDGFISDRVVLYLGEPHIEKWVPPDCFVDLRPYYDRGRNRLDVDAVMERVNTMTQDAYDGMLQNARRWRKTLAGRHEEAMTDLTKRLILGIQERWGAGAGAGRDPR